MRPEAAVGIMLVELADWINFMSPPPAGVIKAPSDESHRSLRSRRPSNRPDMRRQSNSSHQHRWSAFSREGIQICIPSWTT